MTPFHRVERELQVHGRALRALARALVGETDADDLVQETALRALRAPPPEPGSLGGWFATTLRNLAHKHRRGAQRRSRREHRAAQRESVPAADDACFRSETLRAVTDAVLALREPYQRVILQRYFDELMPAEIAARAGVPVATVKSRLQRALAMVREELGTRDRRDGDWRALLLAALGTGSPPLQKTPLVIGGLWMAAQTKLLLLLAAAGIVLATAVTFLSDAGWPVGGDRDDGKATATARVESARAPAPDERREVGEATAPDPGASALPHAFELRVHLLDRDGLPVSGQTVVVAPADCVPNIWPRPTDADGTVAIDWGARVPDMPMTVGRTDGGGPLALRQVEVRAGVPLDVTLVQDPPRCASSQTPTGGESVMLPACAACHKAVPWFRGIPFEGDSLHPDAQFADILLKRPPEIVDEIIEDVSEWSSAVGLGGPGSDRGTVAGVVFDDSGAPASGVTVVWGTEVDRPIGRVRSRGDGSYRFEGLPPGDIELRAGGGDEGLVRVRVAVPAGGPPVRVDMPLEKGAVVRGRALGTDGEPLAGYVVEFETRDGTWADACTTRDDGAFELPNQPVAPGSLALTRSAGDVPVAFVPHVTPGGFAEVLDLRACGPARGSLAVQVRAPESVVGIEVRAWHTDSGRARVFARAGRNGFVTHGLATGRYRVEIGSVPAGRLDLGEVWVDGRTPVDLGDVALPEPAELRLTGAQGELAELHTRPPVDPDEQEVIEEEAPAYDSSGVVPELYARRWYGDVRAEDSLATMVERTPLPAGDWLMLWRNAPDGPLRSATFHAAPGERITVDLR